MKSKKQRLRRGIFDSSGGSEKLYKDIFEPKISIRYANVEHFIRQLNCGNSHCSSQIKNTLTSNDCFINEVKQSRVRHKYTNF
jgi:hypothetical protein